MCLDCKRLFYESFHKLVLFQFVKGICQIWDQIQTKKMNRLSMKQMELWVFVQTNLRVIESLGDRMHLKQLNHGKYWHNQNSSNAFTSWRGRKSLWLLNTTSWKASSKERERHARDTLKSKKCDPEFFWFCLMFKLIWTHFAIFSYVK
jgi:hypothetical protein